MDKERKKELRKQYEMRHPDMGVVCWRNDEDMWLGITKDERADFNGTSFQLKLGSWPNKELQKAFKDNPDSFRWEMIRKLEYKDPLEDHTEDLEILLMEVVEDYPDAKLMRPVKKRR